MTKKRPYFTILLKRLQEPRRFIQALIGPRQVGKTTLALQTANELGVLYKYISADLATLQDTSWLHQQWETARELAKANGKALLIIDEIQKILNWPGMLKLLWDQDSASGIDLRVLILGSSPWLMQRGLSDSLAGRFEVFHVPHWSYQEMKDVFGWRLNKFLYFGGYPGPAPFADEQDSSRWVNYINDSIIETAISRDILLMSQVNKPMLLRRLFQIGCNYSCQIVSYNKMLNQLQDAGNTTTLAHYLELLGGAGLITGLQKFSPSGDRRRGSSPKFPVFNTALLSALSGKSFREASKDPVFFSRLKESAVGAHLLNGIRGTRSELFYWREGNTEVDFVLQIGDKVIAIEVASNKKGTTGIDVFKKKFKPYRTVIIEDDESSLEAFLSKPPNSLFEDETP